MSQQLAISVNYIDDDGNHYVTAVDYGKHIVIRPMEAQVLVPWAPSIWEYIEISDEVFERELGFNPADVTLS